MIRIGTYLSVGGLGTAREVHAEHLDAIQLRMAPVAPLIGFRQGGDLRWDGTGGAIIRVGPNRLVLNANGEDYAVETTETTGGAGVTPDTWYYVYLTASVTTETIEVTTAAPDAALVYRNGVPSRRFLGCYRVDATGMLAFYKAGPRYVHRRSLVAATRFRAAQIVGAAAFSAKSLAAWVPPHARQVHVMIDVYHTAAASAGVRTTGDTGFENGRVYVKANSGVLTHCQGMFSLECDAAQQIDLDLTGGGTVDLYVVGFDERSV